MTYKQLKEKLEKLSEEQLKQQVAFGSDDFCGKVKKMTIAKDNWYCENWAYPFTVIASESQHVKWRNEDTPIAEYDDDEWEIHNEWLTYLKNTGMVFKKGAIFLQIEEDKRIRHQSITDCNAGW